MDEKKLIHDKKKTVILSLVCFILGIIIGLGTALLINNSLFESNNNNSGTIIDVDGEAIEEDDTEQDGVTYEVCITDRRGEVTESAQRQWYGSYKTIKEAVAGAKEKITDTSFHEIMIYKVTNNDMSSLTYVGKTYYCKQ